MFKKCPDMRLKLFILLFLASSAISCLAQDETTQYISDKELSLTPELTISNLELVGEVDERFQSVNIEMCEVVGGDFWVPYHLIDTARVRAEGFAALKRKIDPIDLYNSRLRTLASALGPMYVRVSGTWANTTYFQDNGQPKLPEAPEGYENVLTRSE